MRTRNGEIPSWRAALEETAVAFGIVFLATMAAFGYPPTLASLYISGIAAGLWGLKTWAEARALHHIRLPEET